MFNKLKRAVNQTQQDVKAVQRGDGDEALKRRLRPEAMKRAPGGSTGKKLMGKLFR